MKKTAVILKAGDQLKPGEDLRLDAWPRRDLGESTVGIRNRGKYLTGGLGTAAPSSTILDPEASKKHEGGPE